MRATRLFLVLLVTGPANHAAQPAAAPAPTFDAPAFIAGSSKLLREREPELTAAEYAIYEQVVPLATGQPDFALRLLEGMVDKENSSAAFDLILGNVYFELKRLPEAEARYRRAIAKHGDFRRAWENLGVLLYSTDKHAEAVPCFAKVIQLGGLEPRILGLLGFCFARSGNPTAAELAYMQAAVIEPENPDWLEGLLHVVLETRQFPRAETLLLQLTRLKPQVARNWEVLANVLIAQNRPRDAIVPLELAAGLEILPPDGLRLLGDLYVDAGLAREAVRAFQKLNAIDPNSGTQRLVGFARALVEVRDLDAAEKLLADIEPTARGEQRLTCLHLRADIHRARGNLPAAQAALEMLLASAPLNGRALLALAELQIAQDDPVRAAFTLEAAARVAESAFAANLHLAQLRVAERDFSAAVTLLDQALALEESPVVREYRSRVVALIDEIP